MSTHRHRRGGRHLETKSLSLERKDETNTEIAREIRGFGADIKALKDKHAADIEEVRNLAEQTKERADLIETALRRSHTADMGELKKGPTAEQKAFYGFLRRGPDALPDVERKALVQGDNTQGGYLAPSQFSTEVVKSLVQFSPIRQVARVGSMSASEIIIPKRTGAPTATWVGETEDRPGTQQAYGQVVISAHESACYIDVSVKLLEDAAFAVEAEIAMDLAEEFARLEGNSFVLGDGVKKPSGFLVNPHIMEIASGHATQITSDALIDFFYTLPAFYRNQSTWLMNGTSLGAVRKLKDGQGQYLWQSSIAAGQPQTILGRPVVEAIDMPDIGAGFTPIALGAFSQGYRIYDRVGMSVLRDPFTMATKGFVRFHARRRVGADVVKAEALRKLKVAASL